MARLKPAPVEDLAAVSASDILAAQEFVASMQGEATVIEGQVVRSKSVKYLDGVQVKRAPVAFLKLLWGEP